MLKEENRFCYILPSKSVKIASGFSRKALEAFRNNRSVSAKRFCEAIISHHYTPANKKVKRRSILMRYDWLRQGNISTIGS